jgi:predicted GNAT family N-acyltransferase
MQQNLHRFQLLAPAQTHEASTPLPCARNPEIYEKFIISMQRLRARVYLKDAAIREHDLDESGRHRMDDDEKCWHLLLLDSGDEVVGCARYLLHAPQVSFDDLRLRHSPLAKHSLWGKKLRSAIEADLEMTRELGLGYAELGGWAVAEQYRNTRAALEMLLGSYAWGQLVGNCICSCTATVRNRSSSILRRIGGTSPVSEGQPLPPYEDPNYGCVMEVLRFDSRSPENRFKALLSELTAKLKASDCVSGGCSELGRDELLFTQSLTSLSAALKPNPIHETINRSVLQTDHSAVEKV